MEVDAPTWDDETRGYRFHVRSDASACMIQTQALRVPQWNDLSGVISAFLTGAANHLPPINPKHFASRLEHVWATSDFDISAQNIRVTWIPSTIHIYSTKFVIEWEIQSVEEVVVRIPSGFIQDLSEVNQLPPEAVIHRRRIEETRLRVASLRLRAEKMVEAYYTKYGDLLSDSSLSESD